MFFVKVFFFSLRSSPRSCFFLQRTFLQMTFSCEVVRVAQLFVGWDTGDLKAHSSRPCTAWPGAPSHQLSEPSLGSFLQLPRVARSASPCVPLSMPPVLLSASRYAACAHCGAPRQPPCHRAPDGWSCCTCLCLRPVQGETSTTHGKLPVVTFLC